MFIAKVGQFRAERPHGCRASMANSSRDFDTEDETETAVSTGLLLRGIQDLKSSSIILN